MNNMEVREALHKVSFFLDNLEIKGLGNADLVVAIAQTIKALENEFAEREVTSSKEEN